MDVVVRLIEERKNEESSTLKSAIIQVVMSNINHGLLLLLT